MVTGTMESSCLENSMGKHYYAWKERKEGKEGEGGEGRGKKGGEGKRGGRRRGWKEVCIT